ncbi:thioredoxin domain-containing protein [Marisediminicola sp. LYQ85]|uniref:thioredoxin domain-containing protein n=1 Tax=Marisediminicola sp. LYQ85 TaxID=3391062 RepID=UPI003982DDE4
MPNRLIDAVSPYLRSHADNPVDWQEWGPEAFAEAAERDVPVLVSIGYSTCHWCHVMARESFSDPVIAEQMNRDFVSIKVDREEHPEVDSSYLAAAGAFTGQLGWPLNVFVTPAGKAFFAGTYFPPQPVQGHPPFRTVLDAVADAWRDRRDEVESNADTVARAIAGSATLARGDLPTLEAFDGVVRELVGFEDTEFGGFGTAPKFPVVPVLGLLLDAGSLPSTSTEGRTPRDAGELARRTLGAMASSPLRDAVEGGFFRYSTRRDWSEPHYERMLYDNALLLGCYARSSEHLEVAEGIAQFLGSVMRLESGAFASAQDSESTVDGERTEGGYYRLGAVERSRERPPALDEKVLTGWNGLAIEALADAGFRHDRSDWIDLARDAAEHVLSRHRLDDGTLVRASIGQSVSAARATLEDYGMFAAGLLRLGLASGDHRWALAARELVDGAMAAAGDSEVPFAVPGGGDPVLASQGLSLDTDPSEGAYPSGVSSLARTALTLHSLTGEAAYAVAAERAMALVAPLATPRPVSFGAALGAMLAIAARGPQIVVVTGADDGSSVVGVARSVDRAGAVVAIVSESSARAFADAGFELFAGRTSQGGLATAYVCREFVCRLPVTAADAFAHELASAG